MSALEIELRGTKTIVRLPPRIDVSNAKTLVDAVRAEIAENRLDFVFDFSKTETIDSTALGAIIQLYKTVKTKDGELKLAAVGEGVKRVLAITRVDRVFSIHQDVEAALA